MLTADAFLAEIERFLERSKMTPTAFGKDAVGDPSFVPDLRSGRAPGLRLVERVQRFIEEHETERAA